MLDKLIMIEANYSQIEARLGASETYGDPDLVARLNKEQAELQPLVDTFRTYRRTLDARDQAEALMSDPEMKELAQEERRQALEHSVVMDGRDIGTVILPEAQLKVFLTATAEERARRRTLQLEEAGQPAEFEQVRKEVVQRDRQDAEQLDAVAPDALRLDTTGLSFDQVVEKIAELARALMDPAGGKG